MNIKKITLNVLPFTNVALFINFFLLQAIGSQHYYDETMMLYKQL